MTMAQDYEPLYSLDRIENGIAVLVGPNGEQLNVPIAQLADGAQIGALYRLTHMGLVLEPALTNALKAKIAKLMDDVWNQDPQSSPAAKAGANAAQGILRAAVAALKQAKSRFVSPK